MNGNGVRNRARSKRNKLHPENILLFTFPDSFSNSKEIKQAFYIEDIFVLVQRLETSEDLKG